MQSAINYLYSATNTVTQLHSSCNLSGSGQTDMVWMNYVLGSGQYGGTRCDVWWDDPYADRCDRFRAVVDKNFIDSATSNRENQYTKTACHELGHTVGLAHYDPMLPAPAEGHDCMRSGLWADGSAWTRTYNSHHIDHINAWF
ncbi:hypothetical protein Plo01_35450 [Planobispora longispora]|uniref:Uncharacterized protein n=2 Tax=Planobispora longispora TaxID=28887 RepID=A0A8J3W6S3_9ACTN|nr:hypothetical protein GCM10020093_029470 [Planobispora longispora]GIH77116.1 hypothetical protein Plo01_35450 [Planobispora longispora]